VTTRIVVVSPEQLRELVAETMREVMAELGADSAPALLDRQAAAKALGISSGTLDRLRARGLPVVMVVCSPIFELGACIAWLKEHET
jgi:hypothetical protein